VCEGVQVAQSDTRDDLLELGPSETCDEPGAQLELARGACRKIRVAGLGGRRHEAAPVVEQVRFPEARPGGDESRIAAQIGPPFLQQAEFIRLQHRDGVRDGHKVVQQVHRREAELDCGLAAVHHPPHVRQLGAIVDDRTGDAE
jgi:hypothetical protein